MNNNSVRKAQIRDSIRLQRRMLTEEQVAEYDSILAEQFLCTDDRELRSIISSAECIALYRAVNGELPCDGIAEFFVKNGRTICYPRVKGEDMEFYEITDFESQFTKGAYGIQEPKTTQRKIYPSDIDLMIVPAVAFNDEGIRLGQGGGYYDRWLAKAEKNGKLPYTIGVCYDFQIYSALPVEKHDRAVDCIMCVYTGDNK